MHLSSETATDEHKDNDKWQKRESGEAQQPSFLNSRRNPGRGWHF